MRYTRSRPCEIVKHHFSSETNYLRGCSALSLTMLLATGPAWAAPATNHAYGEGAGTLITRAGPCADLPCSEGNSCHCLSGQGHVKISTAGSRLPTIGSFRIEVVTEDVEPRRTAYGGCVAADGYVTIATRRGTITLPIFGPAYPTHATRNNNAPERFQVAAETRVSSGTGDFQDSHGAGTVSADFATPKVRLMLDWES